MNTFYLLCSPLWLCCFLIACANPATETRQPASTETNAPTQPVGGAFENREFTYYGIPKVIGAVDTSPGWTQTGQRLLLTGTIFHPDGTTPAPGVLLYYYHTNTAGRYEHKTGETRSQPPNEQGQTHGFIRGWIKTDANGRYAIYTVRPTAYPSFDDPAHVHATIKEPNDLPEYYIDDFVFDDDPLLTAAKRNRLENRAGSGVVRLEKNGDVWIGRRDIFLGRNIPNYPISSKGKH